MRTGQRLAPWLIFCLPAIVALVSLGCTLTGRLGTAEVARPSIPTRTPMPTFTPTAVGLAFVENQPGEQPASQQPPAPAATEIPTETPTPAPPTETPTPEPTATPEGVTVTLSQNMNVRGGPGTNYPVVGPGPAGASASVLGRNSDSSWLQIEYPPGPQGIGWIYAQLVQISGNPETVAVAEAPPPPPPPTPVPEPPQAEAPPPEPEKKYQFTPIGWHASGNAAIVHFKGRFKDEGGNLVNGYSVLIDNWAFSVVSHPSGASHWYPEKGDGEWDVVMPDPGTGLGWWYLTVVRYDCPGFFESGFDSQCKQFTRLSEDVKIMVNWPDETIINADWICHWDCDKGLYTQGFHR